jgi:zinc transport system substrate-binding protein
MKKMIALVISLVMLVSCAAASAGYAREDKLNVVVTIFPIYDWVREIVGTDMDHVNLTLLLDNGVDLHSYQPTARDIMTISTADLFVYVGGESDEWVEDVLASAMNPGLVSVSLVDAMGEDIKAEEIVEGMEHEHEHEHDHEEGEDEDHDHEDHDHDHEEEDHDHEGHEHDHEHEHEEEADEHVWLSLRCAQKLTAAIAEAIGGVDTDHAAHYQENASAYTAKLADLDARYTETVNAAAFKTLLFGDRFPFRYLADDYGLEYFAAFTGCSAESEASFSTVMFLAQKVDELGLPAVLTLEHPTTRIAQTVADNTAAKNQKILALDSMQGTTAADIAAGMTYLSVMESNLGVLAEALN